MKKILLILLCLPFIGFGQNVNIPDAQFKAYLVGNTAINTNGDTEIQLSEANAFNGTINCSYLNISDLTGIETFTALTELECFANQLTILDVSQNSALTYLNCNYNQLTSLDVSNNTALTYLYCEPAGIFNQLTSLDISNNINLNTLICRNNQLTSLDISNNINLNTLICPNNQITSLDVSNNTNLGTLWCYSNQLTSLDVSNNTNLGLLDCNNNQLTSLNVRNGNNNGLFQSLGLYEFNVANNPNLNCINVDDSTWSATNWTVANSNIDPQHYFSNNCSGTTDIEEHSTNKELLKVTDLLGRETKQTNQPLFYIYDDGTVEKRIVIE